LELDEFADINSHKRARPTVRNSVVTSSTSNSNIEQSAQQAFALGRLQGKVAELEERLRLKTEELQEKLDLKSEEVERLTHGAKVHAERLKLTSEKQKKKEHDFEKHKVALMEDNQSLRDDNKVLRDENKQLREESKLLRAELKELRRVRN